MQHSFPRYRRERVTDYIWVNRPVSIKEVAEYIYKAKDTDETLSKAVSSDVKKCYETTSKDIQKLRKDGIVPYDAIIFPIERKS